ncbi:hypothetical protein BU23DRAFT_561019 [Bimuria novae-zelandiae CBS 107.79]|uniref:Uncharacterized protein n=1 Tax=Bimuria novae-zelandiae CBS 107.79 TaxID=1447943 RepID=A0A6A5URD7_9PLEO|nr:hypothetical protein BU23DRAFT_561019 [Bimuria novae-zelandiae CBS 107.79]
MEVIYKKVDDYVDSLAPQIQPRIASEIDVFQQKTIDSLEDQVVEAFRSLFTKDTGEGRDRGDLNDAAPDAYGNQSLPFADEIAKLTRSFGKISDEAGDDLRDIFDLTEGRDGPGVQARGQESSRGGARGFLASALDVVQDRLDDNRQSSGGGAGGGFQLDGLLGVISNTVKDASRNPEEKARLISPEIKEKVGAKLREQHAPIAEQFTRIALEHIKRWLRGNTSSRDLGDGAKVEIEDQVKDLVKGIGGLFGSKKHANEGSSRAVGDDGDERGGGFSRVISDKLSTGLAKVHREVRLEFRKILGAIERQLFELLPDQFQRPLEKILGGNPFDAQLDRDAGPQADRSFGDDIKTKLLSKIRDLVRKVQESLRESILGVVNGGHRKFEHQSWIFVQNIVEAKVQRYLPDVKIRVPDDIGNESVSVGAPSAGMQLGQGQAAAQEGYNRPQSQGQQGGQAVYQQEPAQPPPAQHHQEYRNDGREQYPGSRLQGYHQDYPPDQHQRQEYRPNYEQTHPPPHYQSTQPQDYSHGQQHQNYAPPNNGYQGDQGYQHGQLRDPGQGFGERREYGNEQGGYRPNEGYRQDQGHPGGREYGQNPPY